MPNHVVQTITTEILKPGTLMHRRGHTTPIAPPNPDGTPGPKLPPVMHPACQTLQNPPAPIYEYSWSWAKAHHATPCPDRRCFPSR